MNNNRKYVIVVNRGDTVSPIRHIICLGDDPGVSTEEIKHEYYEKYRELDGDEFILCNSYHEMREKEAKLAGLREHRNI